MKKNQNKEKEDQDKETYLFLWYNSKLSKGGRFGELFKNIKIT